MDTQSSSSAALADLRLSLNKLGRVASPEMIASLQYFIMVLKQAFKSSKIRGSWEPCASISLKFCDFFPYRLPGISLEVIFFFHFVKNGTEEPVNLYSYQNSRNLKNVVFGQKNRSLIEMKKSMEIG